MGTPGRYSTLESLRESGTQLILDFQKPGANWAHTPALALENAASTLAMLCLGLVFLREEQVPAVPLKGKVSFESLAEALCP